MQEQNQQQKLKQAAENPKKLILAHLRINEFGEINSGIQVDKINRFLDNNLTDKKLQSRL